MHVCRAPKSLRHKVITQLSIYDSNLSGWGHPVPRGTSSQLGHHVLVSTYVVLIWTMKLHPILLISAIIAF